MLQRFFLLAFLLASGSLLGCLPTTSEAAFVGGREEIRCEGVWPVCQGKYAGCQLDEAHFVGGTFPSSRKVLVETTDGDWMIKVLLFLDPDVGPRFPGTETEISWYEPGCSDQYRWQMSLDNATTGDLFERAGRDNVFEIERAVIEPGDHLIEIYSDATSRYLMRIEINKRQR